MKSRFLGGAVLFASLAVIAVWATGQESPQPTSPENVRLIASIDGPTLYRTYCAVCHGNTARGDGPMAPSLKVAPSALTLIASHNGGQFPLSRVEKIITGDEELTRGHGTRAMPVWGPIFSQIAW